MIRFLFLCLLLNIGFGCTSSKDSDPSHPILIGEFSSLTGSESSFGLSAHRGIQLAIDEQNAAGGVHGRKLELITKDDESRVDKVRPVVTELITQHNVVALLGEVASHRSLEAARIAQKHNVPMITPNSTNPQITLVGNNIFRACFIDPFQGFVMAKFARENLKLKRVAILKDARSDYSLGLAEAFTKTFEEMGGEVATEQTYTTTDTEFKTQLLRIKAEKPDGLFIPGYYSQVALIARQARQLGIKTQLLGGDGWDSPQLYEVAKDAINGGYFSNHFSADSTDPNVQAFVAKFRQVYNLTPDGLAAQGYDAARLLIQAIERTKNLSAKNLRQAIAETKKFPGVTGEISFNKSRNPIKPAVILRVDGPIHRYVTTVKP